MPWYCPTCKENVQVFAEIQCSHSYQDADAEGIEQHLKEDGKLEITCAECSDEKVEWREATKPSSCD